jgi:hypothetical protein
MHEIRVDMRGSALGHDESTLTMLATRTPQTFRLSARLLHPLYRTLTPVDAV